MVFLQASQQQLDVLRSRVDREGAVENGAVNVNGYGDELVRHRAAIVDWLRGHLAGLARQLKHMQEARRTVVVVDDYDHGYNNDGRHDDLKPRSTSASAVAGNKYAPTPPSADVLLNGEGSDRHSPTTTTLTTDSNTTNGSTSPTMGRRSMSLSLQEAQDFARENEEMLTELEGIESQVRWVL